MFLGQVNRRDFPPIRLRHVAPIHWQNVQKKSHFSGRPMDKGATDDPRKSSNFRLVHDGSSWSMTAARESQDEVLLRMRWSQIPSYLFRSGQDFPVQAFSGWCHWSGEPIVDEFGVGLFLVSSVAPLSIGRPEKCDFFWTFCQWIGATCHGFIGRKSHQFTWPRNMPRVSHSFVCAVSDVRAHCL